VGPGGGTKAANFEPLGGVRRLETEGLETILTDVASKGQGKMKMKTRASIGGEKGSQEHLAKKQKRGKGGTPPPPDQGGGSTGEISEGRIRKKRSPGTLKKHQEKRSGRGAPQREKAHSTTQSGDEIVNSSQRETTERCRGREKVTEKKTSKPT